MAGVGGTSVAVGGGVRVGTGVGEGRGVGDGVKVAVISRGWKGVGVCVARGFAVTSTGPGSPAVTGAGMPPSGEHPARAIRVSRRRRRRKGGIKSHRLRGKSAREGARGLD
jgi:hypothetical protein